MGKNAREHCERSTAVRQQLRQCLPFLFCRPISPPRLRSSFTMPLGPRFKLHFWNRLSHVIQPLCTLAWYLLLHLHQHRLLHQVLSLPVCPHMAHDAHAHPAPCPCRTACSSRGVRAAHTHFRSMVMICLPSRPFPFLFLFLFLFLFTLNTSVVPCSHSNRNCRPVVKGSAWERRDDAARVLLLQ